MNQEQDFDIRNSERDKDFERALRPNHFEAFNGQEKIVANLKVFVEAARMRHEALDHILLFGPPGLGKTTLAGIIANELGVGFKVTSGPVLDKPGDLAGILTTLEENDVLFIDEIHRLSPVVEEYLYSAMEDYRIDIMIDKGPGGAFGAIVIEPVYARGCHHSQRPADGSPACAFRYQLPSRILRSRHLGAHYTAQCGVAEGSHYR